MAKEEGISVDEVCRRLILELAAEDGDESALAQISFNNYREAIERATEAATRHAAKAAEAAKVAAAEAIAAAEVAAAEAEAIAAAEAEAIAAAEAEAEAIAAAEAEAPAQPVGVYDYKQCGGGRVFDS